MNDEVKDEFEATDFHPGEDMPSNFGFAVYLDNLRHSLNLILKRPIKKRFAVNCSKMIIQV
jgi:hypothetical protein